MRISDWSSDVCSSDLFPDCIESDAPQFPAEPGRRKVGNIGPQGPRPVLVLPNGHAGQPSGFIFATVAARRIGSDRRMGDDLAGQKDMHGHFSRSEEHTSELQSLMRISYAVFCLKQKNTSN